MSLKLSILLTADGKVAKAEIVGVEGSLKKAGDAAEKMGKQGDKAAASTKKMGGDAKAAATKVSVMSAAEIRAAASARELAKANRVAASQTGNLTAQINDIGVMLAAGQNPFQLAMQQGTQINQVFAQMGGGKAALAGITGAFTSMINPVSLATLGIIGGGAALLQWGMAAVSAGNDGRDFIEVVEDVKGQISEYIDLIESADQLGGDSFATARASIELTSQAYSDLISIAKIEAFQGVENLNATLVSSVLSASYLKTQMGDVGDLLDIETVLRGNVTVWKENRAEVAGFIEQLNALENAATLDEQYGAALQLRDTFKSTVDVTGEMSESQLKFWKNLSLSIQQMELLGAAVKSAAIGGAQAMADAERLLGQQMVAQNGARAVANQEAQKLLANLGQQVSVQSMIALHGADSVEVARLRAQHEREAFVAATNARNISEDLKQELIDAHDAAARLAATNISSGISPAVSEAQRLADWLGVALSTALAISATTPAMADEDAVMSQSVLPNAAQRETNRKAVTNFQRLITPKTRRSGGRAGGAGGRAAQTNEVEQLTKRLQQELDVLRESDEVQKELIRNRETLAKASAGERAQIEQLITLRHAENKAIEQLAERQDFFRSAGETALDSLLIKGQSLDDMLKDIAVSFLDAAIQAAAFGSGPFGSGTSIMDMIFPQKRAAGGPIHGPGGPTDDRVPVWASDGEYIVNARATSRNRHLLDMINAGSSIPAFASGGAIGGSRSPASAVANSDRQPMQLNVYVDGARGDQEIREMVQQGVQQGLEMFDLEVLPGRVGEISQNPRLVG